MKKPLQFELLEDRLAPANLTMTNLRSVDASNALQPSPVFGQMIYLRANWNASAMAGGEACTVRYTVNSFAADSGTVTHGAGSSGYNWYRGGWYIGTSAITVTATIDPDNLIAETDETDNTMSLLITPIAPTDLPSKFLTPIGRAATDWGINNYADVDPRATLQDAFGGDYTYNGHDAIDAGPWGQDGIDKGFPIYAVANGTVMQAVDGNYDRNTAQGNVPANYVRINHGNNWETLYYHFAENTLTVKVGDVVKAGQVIGLMGSSGSSTGCHLHYTAFYRGCQVEAQLSPSTYWITPPLYAANVPGYTLETFITNRVPGPDVSEHESVNYGYGTAQSGTLYFVSEVYNVRTPTQTNTMTWKWYRPNGTLAYTSNSTPSNNYHFSYWYFSRPISQFTASVGTWQYAFELNGVEQKRIPFTISATGDAAIRVSTSANAIILDERTTPFDYGSVATGGAAPQQSYTILNHGGQALSLSNYDLPPGFSIVGVPPASVAAGASATLTVQLDSSVVGYKFGRVKFNTNDPESAEFTFNVEGTVTGSIAAGTPAIVLPDRSLGYNLKSLPRVFAPTATLTDSDSVNFSTGTLTAEVAVNGDGSDVLSVRHQGTTAGLIGVSGANVSYGGTIIGTLSGGSAGVPLSIALNSSATLAATQALIRNLTYANTSTTPFYNHRYLRVKLTDDTGKLSNLANANVTPSGVERAPTIAALADTATTTGYALSRNGSFNDPFSNSWTATVDYGDGAGPQPLSLNANKTFTLNKLYATAGAFTVTVAVTSDTGGIRTGTFTVNVYVPPLVTSVAVNDVTVQRSRLTKIVVSFSGSIDAAVYSLPGAVSLTRTTPGVGPTVDLSNGLQIAPTTGMTNSITLTFANTNTPGINSGSLADGRWRMNIAPLNYQSTLNDTNLRRLYGDENNDGTVNAGDFAAFGNFFGQTVSNNPFDFNSDGTIQADDFAEFGNRFGLTL